uniref:MHC class II beta chain N-terminal domain-containing protein n=1 Tax=Cyanistes caeruleus TaxID=156563 RepID=A0A8C0UVC3_CYACU
MTPQLPGSPTAPRAPQLDSNPPCPCPQRRPPGESGEGGGVRTCPALAMGRVEMDKSECHFIKCTDHTKFMERNIYTQEQLLHFNSDVGLFVGDTSFGKKVARYCNSNLKCMEHRQAAVDSAPSISISLVPSSSQPGPGRLLCSLMDFSPAHIQLSCSQGQQQLSGHMLATAVLPSGDWSQQLLVLLETAPGNAGSAPAASSTRLPVPSLLCPAVGEKGWELWSVRAAASPSGTGILAQLQGVGSLPWGQSLLCPVRVPPHLLVTLGPALRRVAVVWQSRSSPVSGTTSLSWSYSTRRMRWNERRD